jgi:uncharacterized membrane protein YkvA (DUF1232 family)
MITEEQIEKFKALCKNLEVIQKTEYLFSQLLNPETPLWLHATIISGLLYVINPWDLIPDLTPVIGYMDDIATIGTIIGLLVDVHNKRTNQ